MSNKLLLSSDIYKMTAPGGNHTSWNRFIEDNIKLFWGLCKDFMVDFAPNKKPWYIHNYIKLLICLYVHMYTHLYIFVVKFRIKRIYTSL